MTRVNQKFFQLRVAAVKDNEPPEGSADKLIREATGSKFARRNTILVALLAGNLRLLCRLAAQRSICHANNRYSQRSWFPPGHGLCPESVERWIKRKDGSGIAQRRHRRPERIKKGRESRLALSPPDGYDNILRSTKGQYT
jgi:hypothetical protein